MRPSKPDVCLALDAPVSAVEVSPNLWNVWTAWRTGVVGLLLPGNRDQVTEAFNQALREQYVQELRLYAMHVIVDKQPKGGPRMWPDTNASRWPTIVVSEGETIHPRFVYASGDHSIVLTVNSGYEWMEANFGGPVWHASAAPMIGLPKETLRDRALAALKGVGDARAGQWEEWTGRAFHIRRRLSAEEARTVGPVVDVRGTVEAEQRLAVVAAWLPPGWTE